MTPTTTTTAVTARDGAVEFNRSTVLAIALTLALVASLAATLMTIHSQGPITVEIAPAAFTAEVQA